MADAGPHVRLCTGRSVGPEGLGADREGPPLPEEHGTYPGVTAGGMTRMASSRAWCSASAKWVSTWTRPL